jgi:putative transposase
VKKKRFSVEQIVGVLKQGEVGVPIGELVRQVGISEQTFYRWKRRYAKLEVDQVRQLKQLQEENQRLKRLVADLTMDNTMLQNVLAKKSKAFTTPSGGRLPAWRLRSERAARLHGHAAKSRDVSLSKPPGSADGIADENAGDCGSAGMLRMPEDSGAAAAGKLPSG